MKVLVLVFKELILAREPKILAPGLSGIERNSLLPKVPFTKSLKSLPMMGKTPSSAEVEEVVKNLFTIILSRPNDLRDN